MIRSLSLVPVLVFAAPATAPTLEEMFPRRAAVYADESGVVRLTLPSAVLTECAPDLADVRLLDASGREIPYAVDGGAPVPWTAQLVAPVLRDLTRDESRTQLGPTRHRERFTIELPPDPVAGRWELVVDPSRAELVARMRVEAGAALIAEGALARQPGLPALDTLAIPAGAPRVLTVTIDSSGGWVAPSLALRGRPLEAEEVTMEMPLAILRTERTQGVSVYELARPRGVVPGALRVDTGTLWFDRPVEVWDQGAGRADALLGKARIVRVDGGSSTATADIRELPIAAASGDRLRVEIRDGDSPALTALAFTAVVRQPALLFHAATSGPEPIASLVFGGGRVRRPDYDLAAFAPRPGERGDADVGRVAALPLFEGRSAATARLGAIDDNPVWRERPSLGFAQRAGAPIDGRRFTHRRTLTVPASPHGVAQLRLVAEDLAVARPDLSDVRVVDSAGRQWPFLLERRAASAWRDLAAAEPSREGRRSVYRLELPVTPLTPDQVEIDSPVEFFDRVVRLRAQDEAGGERLLATARLYRRADDPRPVTIAFEPARITALTLEVDDGDDAPLDLSVRVRIPEHDLYVVAPGGEYSLLVGDSESETPRYELAHIRGAVLATPTGAIDAGTLSANPRFRARSRFAGPARLQAGVWVALLSAIVVLLALTIRLVRSEPEKPSASPPAPPSSTPPAPPSEPPPADPAPPAPPAAAPP